MKAHIHMSIKCESIYKSLSIHMWNNSYQWKEFIDIQQIFLKVIILSKKKPDKRNSKIDILLIFYKMQINL